MLASISSIATNITTSSAEDLNFRMHQFLDYFTTHPDAKIRYISSDVKLWVHFDTSYLSELEERSDTGKYFYLSNNPNLLIKSTSPTPARNGAILIICKFINTIMSSAQETETAAAFINTCNNIQSRTNLA